MNCILRICILAAIVLIVPARGFAGEYAMLHNAQRPEWWLVFPTEVTSGGKPIGEASAIEVVDIVCDGKLIQPEETKGHIDEYPLEFPGGVGSIYTVCAKDFNLRKWAGGKRVPGVLHHYSLDPKSEIVTVRYRLHYWVGEEAKVSEINKLISYEWSALRKSHENQ